MSPNQSRKPPRRKQHCLVTKSVTRGSAPEKVASTSMPSPMVRMLLLRRIRRQGPHPRKAPRRVPRASPHATSSREEFAKMARHVSTITLEPQSRDRIPQRGLPTRRREEGRERSPPSSSPATVTRQKQSDRRGVTPVALVAEVAHPGRGTHFPQSPPVRRLDPDGRGLPRG